MAGLILNIDVNDKGTPKITRFQQVVTSTGAPIGRMGAAANRTAAQVAGLEMNSTRATAAIGGMQSMARVATAALAALGVSLSARAIFEATDAWTNYNNRLKLVTDSAAQQKAAMDAVFDSAQRTGSSLESTITLFSRIAASKNEIGRPLIDLLDFTEQIQKLAAIGGASQQEASAAAIQLSQGLASGVLRGEELNSVMEQTPAIIRALGKELGLGVGQVRAMAKEGKLAADTIITSILNQSETTNKAHEEMATTFDRSWQRMKNSALRAIGEIDQAWGASAWVTGKLDALTNPKSKLEMGLLKLGAGADLTMSIFKTTALNTINPSRAGERTAALAEEIQEQARVLAGVKRLIDLGDSLEESERKRLLSTQNGTGATKAAAAGMSQYERGLANVSALLAEATATQSAYNERIALMRGITAPINVRGEVIAPISEVDAMRGEEAVRMGILELQRDQVDAQLALARSKSAEEGTAAQILKLESERLNVLNAIDFLPFIAEGNRQMKIQQDLLELTEARRDAERTMLETSTQAARARDQIAVDRGQISERDALKNRLIDEEKMLQLRVNQATAERDAVALRNDANLLAQSELQLEIAKNELTTQQALARDQTQPQTLGMGLRDGFALAGMAARDFYATAKAGALDLANTMQTSFTSAFTGLIMRTQTAKQAFQQMAQSVVQSILQIVAKMIFQATVGAALSKFANKENSQLAASALGQWGPPAVAASIATFGMAALVGAAAYTAALGAGAAAGSAFQGGGGGSGGGAPKFHQGGVVGLGPEEVHAILLKGEGVVSRKGMAAASDIGSGKAVAGGGRTIVLEQTIINVAPGEEKMYQAMASSTGKNILVNHIDGDLRENGPIRQTLKANG